MIAERQCYLLSISSLGQSFRGLYAEMLGLGLPLPGNVEGFHEVKSRLIKKIREVNLKSFLNVFFITAPPYRIFCE